MTTDPIIMGIDPALASIGYGVIQGTIALDYGAITTSNKDTLGDRLSSIYNDIKILVEAHSPDIIGLEQPVFYKPNTNSSRVLQAVGVIKLAIAHCNYPGLVLVTQEQGKSAIGLIQGQRAKGAEVKHEINAAVREIFGIEHRIKPDDAADGLAIAYAVQMGKSANVA